MKTIAVIPARGGSKGIPHKNLRKLNGVPLLAIAIRTAKGAEAVQNVVVTTDDSEIADLAISEGAEVVMRPASISGDTDSSESALLHVLQERPEYADGVLIFMQCTSPLTLSSDLDAAVRFHQETGADVVFSAVRSHAFLWRVSPEGEAVEVNHNKMKRPMRQEMTPQFQETGAFYVMKTRGFLAYKNRFFGTVRLYEIPADRALDIDEPLDLDIAEARLTQIHTSTLY